MYVFNLKFSYSVQQLGKQRIKFQHKICFKPSNEHLKLKTMPAISIASRLFRDGNFLRLYKQSQKSFIYILLNVINQLPHNNEFKNLFDRHFSFRDFNRVLFWKIMSVNSLFNLKKLKNKRILYYLKPEKRAVLVLLWLKSLVKLHKKNYKNLTPQLLIPVLQFVYSNKDVNNIFGLKLRIYKLRMSRG